MLAKKSPMLLKRSAATAAAAPLAGWRPDGCAWLIAAAGLLGAALVLAREATYGVNLHYDPVNYIAVARNLLAGQGFANFDGSHYVLWAPLYPLLLAIASLGIFDPLDLAGPLNAALFGLTVIVVGRYLRRRLASGFLTAWACLALALCIPLASQATWAYSGPLFILLATLALIRADEFLAQGRNAALIWAAALSALAWQTRYIGAVVPLAVGLLPLLRGDAALARRLRQTAVVALIAGLPMLLWMTRNYLLAGNPTGNRLLFDHAAWAVLKEAGSSLWKWLNFDLLLVRWSSLAFALQLSLIATVLLPIGYAFARERGNRRALFAWRSFLLFGGFALAYLGLLFLSLMLGAAGMLPRYLLPAYIPLLIAGMVGLDRFLGLERARGARPSLPAAILMLALSLWTLGQVALNLKQIRRANAADLHRDFSALPWTESETLRYVRQHPFSGKSYSNLPFLTYLHTDGAGTHAEMPRDRPGGIAGAANTPSASGREQLQAWLADAADGAIIHWFKDAGANMAYDYGAAEMRAAPGLALVAELADGFIFRVRKAEALRAQHPSTYAAMTAAALGAPAARSFFDLHLEGTRLAYRKQPCSAADRAARFFLHLAPAKAEDLPAHRRRQGFENLDFDFPQRGAVVEGACLAIVQLPDYDILRIRTGQFIRGAGELWQARIDLP